MDHTRIWFIDSPTSSAHATFSKNKYVKGINLKNARFPRGMMLMSGPVALLQMGCAQKLNLRRQFVFFMIWSLKYISLRCFYLYSNCSGTTVAIWIYYGMQMRDPNNGANKILIIAWGASLCAHRESDPYSLWKP